MTDDHRLFASLSLREFSDALASDAATPGGGSAAAIAGSLAAALVSMVTRLSVGRARYAAFAATHERSLEVAEHARQRFLELADEDAAAYSTLVDARTTARTSSPGGVDQDDGVRRAAHEAARVPMLVVRECYALIDQVDRLAGRSNLNTASDLDVAARLLEAAARGAGANVIVNLPAIGDERLADSMLGELEVRLHEIVSAVAMILQSGAIRGFAGTGVCVSTREPEHTARILEGAPIAARIKESVHADLVAIGAQRGALPGIRVFLVGDDAPSRVYAGRILRNAATVGVPGEVIALPAHTTTHELNRRVATASADPDVAGIIVQMPLPAAIPVRSLADALDPIKDIDGIHPFNAGLLAQGLDGHRPSCAEAAVEILLQSGIPIAGRHAVVIGRSNVVGKPAELLLLRHDATVTVCHRKTHDLAREVSRADIIVVAAGSPGLVTGQMVRPGAVVVDCGINVVDGAIVGDVDRASVDPVAGAITPVPGGVGPVTNAVLLRHLVAAIRATPAPP